jgi:oligoribonuclease NrnB/cAMP/cGMP phosphodiesterase (DHH superfamily)
MESFLYTPGGIWPSPLDFDVCLYHDHCPDGTGAAWAFWRLEKKLEFEGFEGPEEVSTRIQTQGVNHNESPPLDLVQGKKVVIVDFCYDREDIKKLCNEAEHVLILDHHDTALRKLQNIEEEIKNISYIFDMSLSGAQIAWDYVRDRLLQSVSPEASPGEFEAKRPWFIEYIADRDLWKWELYRSREIGKALCQGSWYTFEGMNLMYEMTPEDVSSLQEELYISGKIFLEAEERDISYAVHRSVLCEFEGYRVRLTTCSPIIRSEVGSELCKKADCDFAAVWRYDFITDQWWISLRSRKASSPLPLNILCEKYGGGGHPKACGFAIHGRYSREWIFSSSEKRSQLAHGDLHDYFIPIRNF